MMSGSCAEVTAVQRAHAIRRCSLKRLSGVAFGVGTQAVFTLTVVGLYSFLRYGVAAGPGPWLLTDSMLAIQFAASHSILLHPAARATLRTWISAEFYGAFFCLITCISLLLMFKFWRGSEEVLWEFEGISAQVAVGAFFVAWGTLLYSISLTGFGFQTGWTQWLYWYRGKPMSRREFRVRSVYRILRHPVYMSFLGLIWFTPAMTLDHTALAVIWTVYIGVGSVLKDQRMLFYLGASYSGYMQQVTGYPLMLAGPLAKRSGPFVHASEVDSQSTTVPFSGPVSSPPAKLPRNRAA